MEKQTSKQTKENEARKAITFAFRCVFQLPVSTLRTTQVYGEKQDAV
jgi:hypothetical protein